MVAIGLIVAAPALAAPAGHAPATAAGSDGPQVPVRVKARKGATYLGPDETAVAVLNLQHDVATAAFNGAMTSADHRSHAAMP